MATIYQGYDYYEADGQELSWASEDWPDLSGAAVSMIIKNQGTYTGEVVTSGDGIQQEVRVELSSTDTADISPGKKTMVVQATLVNTHVVLLVSEWLYVEQAVTDGS